MRSRYCASRNRLVVAGPVWLHQVPLIRRGANQLLELPRDQLRDALDVVAQPSLPLDGYRGPAHTEVAATSEVGGGRDQRGTRAQRQCRRAARQPGALAEELDFDTAARDVAVTQQAYDVIGLQRAYHCSPGIGAERDDVHAERPSHVGEPLEQLWRV